MAYPASSATQFVSPVVPALRLDFDMLTNHVETEVFLFLDIEVQGLISVDHLHCVAGEAIGRRSGLLQPRKPPIQVTHPGDDTAIRRYERPQERWCATTDPAPVLLQVARHAEPTSPTMHAPKSRGRLLAR